MCKIIEYKTRSKLLKNWFNEVILRNKLLDKGNVKSCLIIWESTDSKGNPVAMHARYNCPLENLEWFKRCIENRIFDMKMHEYLRNNISQYIEYIE